MGDLEKENERLKKENERLKEDLDFKDRNYKSDYVSEEDRERVAEVDENSKWPVRTKPALHGPDCWVGGG